MSGPGWDVVSASAATTSAADVLELVGDDVAGVGEAERRRDVVVRHR